MVFPAMTSKFLLSNQNMLERKYKVENIKVETKDKTAHIVEVA